MKHKRGKNYSICIPQGEIKRHFLFFQATTTNNVDPISDFTLLFSSDLILLFSGVRFVKLTKATAVFKYLGETQLMFSEEIFWVFSLKT